MPCSHDMNRIKIMFYEENKRDFREEDGEDEVKRKATEKDVLFRTGC